MCAQRFSVHSQKVSNPCNNPCFIRGTLSRHRNAHWINVYLHVTLLKLILQCSFIIPVQPSQVWSLSYMLHSDCKPLECSILFFCLTAQTIIQMLTASCFFVNLNWPSCTMTTYNRLSLRQGSLISFSPLLHTSQQNTLMYNILYTFFLNKYFHVPGSLGSSQSLPQHYITS